MQIRPFSDGDEAAVIALWRDANLLVNPLNDPAKDIAFCRSSGHGEILLAEDDGAVVGSVMVGHDGHRGWVYYLASDSRKRHGGLGRALMSAAEAWLRERGIWKMQLMVRDTNTRVIGFYQRLGYMCEATKVLSRRLDGVAVKAGGQMVDEPVVITYLEMTQRPSLPTLQPKARQLAVLRAHDIPVGFYRYLYDAVGRDWYWTDRKVLADQQLADILGSPDVAVYVLYVDGAPAGFFELDQREAGRVDLAYFGLLPGYIGRGLGTYLLSQALDTAWSGNPGRVTVNTCTLDHPHALPMYQRFGFRPYERVETNAPWNKWDAVLNP